MHRFPTQHDNKKLKGINLIAQQPSGGPYCREFIGNSKQQYQLH
jgi:hypothetical protein